MAYVVDMINTHHLLLAQVVIEGLQWTSTWKITLERSYGILRDDDVSFDTLDSPITSFDMLEPKSLWKHFYHHDLCRYPYLFDHIQHEVKPELKQITRTSLSIHFSFS